MSQEEIVERISKLEAQLQALSPKEQEQVKHPIEKVRTVAKFFLSYWTLFSFLFALVVMVYVKYTFDIDYFENYRSVSEIRSLSDFHRKMGDEFIGKTEWQAAEDAYQQALDIDKNNIQAAYGLVKSQVFQPLEGQKHYFPEVVNTRLNYLMDFFPNDYLLSYLRATYYVDKHDLAEARQWFEKSMKENPDYSWNHVALGYILQQEGNFQGALESFHKAVKLDPENEVASGNLGFAYLYTGDFKEAIKYLQIASDISPRFSNYFGIADAHVYSKDFATALAYREVNLKQAVANDPAMERFLGVNSLWMYNYMPLHPGDKETIKQFIQDTGVEKQRIMVYFAVSFDYALNKDFTKADEMFKKGIDADKDKAYRDFFINRINSMQAFVEPEAATNEWLEARKAELSGTEQ